MQHEWSFQYFGISNGNARAYCSIAFLDTWAAVAEQIEADFQPNAIGFRRHCVLFWTSILRRPRLFLLACETNDEQFSPEICWPASGVRGNAANAATKHLRCWLSFFRTHHTVLCAYFGNAQGVDASPKSGLLSCDHIYGMAMSCCPSVHMLCASPSSFPLLTHLPCHRVH